MWARVRRRIRGCVSGGILFEEQMQREDEKKKWSGERTGRETGYEESDGSLSNNRSCEEFDLWYMS